MRKMQGNLDFSSKGSHGRHQFLASIGAKNHIQRAMMQLACSNDIAPRPEPAGPQPDGSGAKSGQAANKADPTPPKTGELSDAVDRYSAVY